MKLITTSKRNCHLPPYPSLSLYGTPFHFLFGFHLCFGHHHRRPPTDAAITGKRATVPSGIQCVGNRLNDQNALPGGGGEKRTHEDHQRHHGVALLLWIQHRRQSQEHNLQRHPKGGEDDSIEQWVGAEDSVDTRIIGPADEPGAVEVERQVELEGFEDDNRGLKESNGEGGEEEEGDRPVVFGGFLADGGVEEEEEEGVEFLEVGEGLGFEAEVEDEAEGEGGEDDEGGDEGDGGEVEGGVKEWYEHGGRRELFCKGQVDAGEAAESDRERK
ncbi:uncharacterized protein G2W53_030613 [Senna tora]|uniref:Uncharacterized protein n=1 Tax=Senna tora TaxID=362788 RepID=A0A834TFU7_9FABA|nr:uncharacterized protein G2W53_030613 [Senna tora]